LLTAATTRQQEGFSKGEEKGHEANTSSVNDFFNSSSNPFRSLTVKVKEVKDDSITIDTTRGETKTVKLNDKTKITKETDTLKASDLKPNQRITIFTQGSEDKLTATRVVVRD
jgi:hypothetical protein